MASKIACETPKKSRSIMIDHTDINPAGRPERDLRLDLLRGIGQWMVFLDHTPYDIVGWLTIRNYGFSDATEFFVFISGYCAGYIYGSAVPSWRVYRCHQTAVQASLATLHRPHFPVFAFHRANRTLRPSSRQPDVRTRIQRLSISSAPRCDDRAGADAEVQARQPRRAAALHRLHARVAVHAVGFGAPPELVPVRLRRAVFPRALVRLEPAILPARHDLVL